MIRFLIFFLCLYISQSAPARPRIRQSDANHPGKLEKINDYQADASLKTNIPFLRVPDAEVAGIL